MLQHNNLVKDFVIQEVQKTLEIRLSPEDKTYLRAVYNFKSKKVKLRMFLKGFIFSSGSKFVTMNEYQELLLSIITILEQKKIEDIEAGLELFKDSPIYENFVITLSLESIENLGDCLAHGLAGLEYLEKLISDIAFINNSEYLEEVKPKKI